MNSRSISFLFVFIIGITYLYSVKGEIYPEFIILNLVLLITILFSLKFRGVSLSSILLSIPLFMVVVSLFVLRTGIQSIERVQILNSYICSLITILIIILFFDLRTSQRQKLVMILAIALALPFLAYTMVKYLRMLYLGIASFLLLSILTQKTKRFPDLDPKSILTLSILMVILGIIVYSSPYMKTEFLEYTAYAIVMLFGIIIFIATYRLISKSLYRILSYLGISRKA